MAKQLKCGRCNGSGSVWERGKGGVTEEKTCPACNGSGQK
jgi:DnaJ-class molecular chaperone